MKNVLYCFDIETKNQLLSNGYTFVKEIVYEKSTAYVFLNNGEKVHFEKNKVFYSNKLTF